MTGGSVAKPAGPGGGLIAIAAIAGNRGIGLGGRIPWHLPEDFKWFKRTTLGHVVVMGRRTFESLPGPLPGRVNVVVTTGPTIQGVFTVRSPDLIHPEDWAGKVFVIGGQRLYEALLPRCNELLISHVRCQVEADAFFPPFEEQFTQGEVLLATADFEVRRHVRREA